MIDADLEFRHTVEVDGEVVEAVVFALLAVHLDAGLFGVLGADGVVEGRLSFNADLAGEVERKHEIRVIADRGDAVADGQRPLEERDRGRVLVGAVGKRHQLGEQVLNIGDLADVGVCAEGDGRGHIVLDVRGDVEIFADRVNVDVGIEIDGHVVVQIDHEVAVGLTVDRDNIGNGDRDVDLEHAVDQVDIDAELGRGLEDVDRSQSDLAVVQLLFEVLLDDDHAVFVERGGRVYVKLLKHLGELGLDEVDSDDARSRSRVVKSLERSLSAVLVLEDEDLILFKASGHAHQGDAAVSIAVLVGVGHFDIGSRRVVDPDAVDHLNAVRLSGDGELQHLCVGIVFEIGAVVKFNDDHAALGPAGRRRIEIDDALVVRAGVVLIIADGLLAGSRLDKNREVCDAAVDDKLLLSGKTVHGDSVAVNDGAAASDRDTARGTVSIGAGSVGGAGVDRLFGLIVGTCHKHRQRHSEHKHERYAKQKSVLPHNHFLRNRFSYTRIRRV